MQDLKESSQAESHIIKQTVNLCPECLESLDATIVERNGKVILVKDCPNHGHFEDLYWADYETYKRFEEYGKIGKGVFNPRTKTEKGYPYDCGICPNHKSHMVLSIIDVTNARAVLYG